MASAIKKGNMITQIVRLKQVVKRWKNKSLKRRSVLSYSSSDSDEPALSGSDRRTPSGSLAVYVGPERRRFVIPTRFLNLPVFISLLDKAEEEFGYQRTGGLVLPCEVEYFSEILRLLDRDEERFGHLGLDELVKLISEVGFESLDQSCKEAASHGFAPLLQNARV
ncbi:PREDICTED: auxin-responsive protein SAUR50-like [Nicotiana attenuata]|uniref:Auxin-induced protein x15 n=1 Tax=Nicotiana attenuata TaxID=49451 RepID=A0A314LCR4_NICAT|nr:PREDICTED: auxin-responsive protein SAUR50-like [Nicotiana attenuata]OIT39445.1 auxin-induced protein x15 [Nicotiana attenuata]